MRDNYTDSEVTRHMLDLFKYDHLSPELQEISKPFHDLAHEMVGKHGLSGLELNAGLRKLVETKDCMVRAYVFKVTW